MYVNKSIIYCEMLDSYFYIWIWNQSIYINHKLICTLKVYSFVDQLKSQQFFFLVNTSITYSKKAGSKDSSIKRFFHYTHHNLFIVGSVSVTVLLPPHKQNLNI